MYNTVIQLNGIIYSTTLDYENPVDSQGIERIELVGTEITSKMIAFTPSNYAIYRPVMFPSDRYQCSTPEGSGKYSQKSGSRVFLIRFQFCHSINLKNH